MKNIILSYALVSEYSFNQTLYELEKSYPKILKMRSKNPLSFIIGDDECIVYVKIIPSIPITKSILDIDESRGFDFKHVVRSIPELINKAYREGKTYEKQMDNYISYFK